MHLDLNQFVDPLFRLLLALTLVTLDASGDQFFQMVFAGHSKRSLLSVAGNDNIANRIFVLSSVDSHIAGGLERHGVLWLIERHSWGGLREVVMAHEFSGDPFPTFTALPFSLHAGLLFLTLP